jgi:glycosyltransferase involved in cell wall biosynthesis
MNILLIIPNLDFGGAQRSFFKLHAALGKDHHVIPVVFNTDTGIAFPMSGELISLEVKGGSNWFTKIFNFFRRVRKLKKIKKARKIDVSISFLEGADFINVLSKVNDKIIVSIRGSKLSDETIKGKIGWIRKKILIPFLYSKSDHITVVNTGIIHELNNHFGLSKIKKTLIYNCYDIASIERQAKEPLPADLNFLSDKPYIIFSGRLAVEKGIDKLVYIYSCLKNRPNFRFVIVGSGPIHNDLLRLCQESGLKVYTPFKDNPSLAEKSEVIFLDQQSNPHQFVGRAEVFLMASSSEGFPNALAEAMICEAPVLSSDCPWGPREILSEKYTPKESISSVEYSDYGVLLPIISLKKGEELKKAIQVWTETLDKFLENPELRKKYAAAGKKRMNFFSMESNLAMWEEIITKS